MAKKELNLGNLLNTVTERVEQANNEPTETAKANEHENKNASAQTVEVERTNSNEETKKQSSAATKQVNKTDTQLRVKKIVPRTNGCTYYLEDKHIDAIDRIKCFNKVDKQVVIRTALSLFLKKYMKADGMGLTPEGMEEVENYMYE